MAYESEYELEAELENEFESEGEFEGEFESETEGEGWLGAIGNVVGSLLGESEGEFEGEGEFESEFEGEFEGEYESEISPIRKIYPDAMMEHLGELAAESESEQEAAEHFLPLIGMAASKLLPVVARAVAPLAKKALPRIAKAVSRVAPQLTKGVGTIARRLYRNPQTRHLLRAVPGVARRTVGSIAKQAAKGRPVSPRVAFRTLAHQTKRVLGTPAGRATALRRHNVLERRIHTRWGRGMVRPHGRYVPGGYAGRRYVAGAAHPAASVAGVPAGRAGVPAGRAAVRYGRTAGGQCVCSPCPSGAATAYCRCCGQVLR
jgi:hypothetical protein